MKDLKNILQRVGFPEADVYKPISAKSLRFSNGLTQAIVALYSTESFAFSKINQAQRNGDHRLMQGLGPCAFLLGKIIENAVNEP